MVSHHRPDTVACHDAVISRRPLIERCFYHYGRFVAQHTRLFIIFPLLLTACATVGFYNFKLDRDVLKLYSPQNYTGDTEQALVADSLMVSGLYYYRVSL